MTYYNLESAGVVDDHLLVHEPFEAQPRRWPDCVYTAKSSKNRPVNMRSLLSLDPLPFVVEEATSLINQAQKFHRASSALYESYEKYTSFRENFVKVVSFPETYRGSTPLEPLPLLTHLLSQPVAALTQPADHRISDGTSNPLMLLVPSVRCSHTPLRIIAAGLFFLGPHPYNIFNINKLITQFFLNAATPIDHLQNKHMAISFINARFSMYNNDDLFVQRNHTHPFCAARRTLERRETDDLITSFGLQSTEVYAIHRGLRDYDGHQSYYAPKDVSYPTADQYSNMFTQLNDPKIQLILLEDCDFPQYLDINQVLRAGKPVLITTRNPTLFAHCPSGNNDLSITHNGSYNYTTDGGGEYFHEMYRYDQDVYCVERNSTRWYLKDPSSLPEWCRTSLTRWFTDAVSEYLAPQPTTYITYKVHRVETLYTTRVLLLPEEITYETRHLVPIQKMQITYETDSVKFTALQINHCQNNATNTMEQTEKSNVIRLAFHESDQHYDVPLEIFAAIAQERPQAKSVGTILDNRFHFPLSDKVRVLIQAAIPHAETIHGRKYKAAFRTMPKVKGFRSQVSTFPSPGPRSLYTHTIISTTLSLLDQIEAYINTPVTPYPTRVPAPRPPTPSPEVSPVLSARTDDWDFTLVSQPITPLAHNVAVQLSDTIKQSIPVNQKPPHYNPRKLDCEVPTRDLNTITALLSKMGITTTNAPGDKLKNEAYLDSFDANEKHLYEELPYLAHDKTTHLMRQVAPTIDPCTPTSLYTKSDASSVISVASRLYAVQPKLEEFSHYSTFITNANIIINSLFNNDLVPKTLEELEDDCTGPQLRKRIMAEYDRNLYSTQVPDHMHNSAFIKAESAAKELIEAKPRNISNPDNWIVVHGSRFVTVATKFFYDTCSGAAFQYNAEQIGDKIHANATRYSTCIETDFSSFDGTQNWLTFLLETLCLKAMFSNHPEIVDIKLLQTEQIFNAGRALYLPGYSRQSGAADTSFSNTLLNALIMVLTKAYSDVLCYPDWYDRTPDLEPWNLDCYLQEGMVAGDDGIYYNTDEDHLEQMVEFLGLKIKAKAKSTHQPVSFLGRVYPSPATEPGSGYEIDRFLAKFPYAPVSNQFTQLEQANMKCLGYLITDHDTPLIGPLLQEFRKHTQKLLGCDIQPTLQTISYTTYMGQPHSMSDEAKAIYISLISEHKMRCLDTYMSDLLSNRREVSTMCVPSAPPPAIANATKHLATVKRKFPLFDSPYFASLTDDEILQCASKSVATKVTQHFKSIKCDTIVDLTVGYGSLGSQVGVPYHGYHHDQAELERLQALPNPPDCIKSARSYNTNYMAHARTLYSAKNMLFLDLPFNIFKTADMLEHVNNIKKLLREAPNIMVLLPIDIALMVQQGNILINVSDATTLVHNATKTKRIQKPKKRFIMEPPNQPSDATKVAVRAVLEQQ